ncbi:AI-2E family transporter [Pseudoclavibacter endophyticus]|uniref:AI-2E family transporter n=1 Tax=Pseudoclavibacter endophyticus TaxID=1778590 RepID=A0A6H9WWH4_9MICO|nr:AI-2E family transporter [Pseudoclavibacter endophyticus]
MPKGMRIAGAWSWRIVAIVLALIPLGWLISQATLIVVPVLVAALLASLLMPVMNVLMIRARFPKWAALIVSLLVLFAAIAFLVWLVVNAFADGFDIDWSRLEDQWANFVVYLRESPLHVTDEQISAAIGQMIEWVESNVSNLLSQAVSVGSTAFAFLTGTLVTLFALIFYLLDGGAIWRFIVSLFPREARAAIDGAGRRGWVTIGHYVRVQIFVAFIDALGIGVGAAILGVPFAVPLAIIVFLASFVPFVGAIASGALAVLVALVYLGFWPAVIMLAIVIGVQQIESHVLQPLIMGQAVKVHPLGVVLSVSAGTLFGGIAGAVFAVPLVASAKVMVEYIASGDWRGLPDPTRAPRRPQQRRGRFVRHPTIEKANDE